jgi:hypothetical protein
MPEYTARNPIADLKSRPRPRKPEAAYFERQELPLAQRCLRRFISRLLMLLGRKPIAAPCEHGCCSE